MLIKDFFKFVYDIVGKAKFGNHAHFISLLFSAAGSNYFPIMESKRYNPNAYQYKIFNGGKPITSNIISTFPEPIDHSRLISFFKEYITNENIAMFIEKFEIKESFKDTSCLANALASQFEQLLISVNNEAPNSVPTIYNNGIVQKYHRADGRWDYKILLLDDNEEILELLEEEIEDAVNKDQRYNVTVIPTTTSVLAIDKNRAYSFDVFVLDIGGRHYQTLETKAHDYYGINVFRDLMEARPDLKAKKFYIYSKLPEYIKQGKSQKFILQEELSGVDLEYYRKQKTSYSVLAGIIKRYLDQLYAAEKTFDK